jgi:hypothetical protein
MNRFSTDDRYFAKHYTKYGVIPTEDELPYKASEISACGKYVHPERDREKYTKKKVSEKQLRQIIRETLNKLTQY